jgi:hypothetical protein
MRFLRPFLTILVPLAFVSTAGAVATQGSKSATASSKPASVRHTSRPVIEFGHQGGNLRPYRVAIYADGRVEAIEGIAPLKGDFIPADKVKELVRKATDKGFWKSGPSKKRPALPDFGFVFVKVRTASGRIIYHKGAQTGPLAEYYALLSDAVFQKP